MLQKIKNNKILDLKKNCWIGTGGIANNAFFPENEKELYNYLKSKKNKKFFVLGNGSNIIFRDKGYSGKIIKLGKGFRGINFTDDDKYLICGAATLKKELSNFALKNNISGFEFLSCIPGNLAGGVKMNAGCFNNTFSDIVSKVIGYKYNGVKKTIPVSKIKFRYRTTNLPKQFVITNIIFKIKKSNYRVIKKKMDLYLEKKNISQPEKIKTSGSTFKNPSDKVKAWSLIKGAGCDKLNFDGAKFSYKHSNFLDNSLNASSRNIEKLISLTIEKVKKKYHIKLNLEIQVVGDK